jgi:hypothetical protein
VDTTRAAAVLRIRENFRRRSPFYPVMATFPILDNLSVASPCSASWDEMTGDARVRHCGDCDQRVYDLSGLTRVEAEGLLVATRGRLCVRYFRRADGTILTRDCPVGARKLARRMRLAAWATAGAAVCAVGTVAATFAFLDARACRTAIDAVVDVVDAPPVTMGAPPPPAMMGEVAPRD